jgi:hypothetical protein
MPKTFLASNGAFRMLIPDNWQEEYHGSKMAFFNPDGVGALVASCVIPPTGVAAEAAKVMVDFVIDSADVDVTSTIRGSANIAGEALQVAYAAEVVGVKAWRHWVFSNKSRAVIFSYNCPLSFRGRADAVLDTIMSTVELSP